MKQRRLSLCMIVKDEENYITNCLKSVKDYVDEMIIVDTGSSDQTVEICSSFGAKVLSFPWNGSFSDARNFGLDNATGDWILWLDADEEVDAADAYKLREILDFNDQILSIHLVNYYGESPDPHKTFDVAHTRLFQNYKGFKFKNNIHEMLNADEVFAYLEEFPTIKTVPIKVYHYGYLDTTNDTKKKFERNFSLLEKELQQEHHSPWIEYHLASEYNRIQQYGPAFDYVNRSIMGFLKLQQTPPSIIYRLKYSILISSGSIEGALPAIDKAIALYPDYVDLHFYKAIILYVKELYQEAIATFEHCLQLGEDHLHHLVLKGVGSFQALYYKGCCHEKLGEIDVAAKIYAEAAQLSKTFTSPIKALRSLIKKNPGIWKEIPESCDDDTIISIILQ